MEKKSRLLYLLSYLQKNSDEYHPVSSTNLISQLGVAGIKAHRSTITADVALLVEAGFDVITVRSSPNKYFIGERQLQLPELKMLVDAVASSKFITAKKSKELIEKIGMLTSQKLYYELNREIYIERMIKSGNEHIYYTVDKIQEAIRTKKCMEFRYLEYTVGKRLTYKNRGYLYRFSPFTTIWSDERYYVVGHSQKHNKIATFRIDRIDKPELIMADAVPRPMDFDPSVYANQVFEMFEGDCIVVELRCAGEFMSVIVDKFGEDVVTSKLDCFGFKATVEIQRSPRFYGWLFGFAGKIQIIGPEDVKIQYQEMLKNALNAELQ